MQQLSSSPEILAHWKYPPDFWRDFVRHESGVYRKSVRSARHFIIGTIIGAVIFITLFSVIPYLVTQKFNSSVWGPAVGILFIAAIFLAIGFVILQMRKEKMARFASKTGEVIITLNGLKMNEADFNWDYMGPGWRFLDAERKSISVDPLKKMEILELRFVTFIPSRNTPQREETSWRIPVRPGTESEANSVIERLKAAHVAFE